jgi:hypothetical protein
MKKFKKNSGMTLSELLIAALILAIMVIFIGSFLISGFQNNIRVQAIVDLGNNAQQTVNQIKLEMSQSKRIFDNGPVGLGYWEALGFQKGNLPLVGSKLPEIISHGSLSPSNEGNFRNPFVRESVGNMIFFVEHLPALESQKDKRIIDLYRFVVYFLSQKNKDRFSPKIPYYLDLVRCESSSYADLSQMYHVQDEEVRANLLSLLSNFGVAAFWDSQADADVAFTQLKGYAPGQDPEVQHRIQMVKCKSSVTEIGRVTRPPGTVTYSVAHNTSTKFPIRLQVPLFAKPQNNEEMFPSGFEVVIVGPKSGRQVLLRLVLAANVRDQILTRGSSVIAMVKDS